MRVEAGELAVMLLGRGDTAGPKHRRLASALIELIDRGELPDGCGLPAERVLASALQVSRTTVVSAYRQLQAIGSIERRSGSGTRVVMPRPTAAHVPGASSRTLRLTSRLIYGPVANIDLASIALPVLPMVAETAAAVDLDSYRRLTGLDLPDVRGLPALRAGIAEALTRDGVPTAEAQIFVTSGAQQAIELVAEAYLSPGDVVAVEVPAYRGAILAFERAGLRVEAAVADEDGLIPEQLEQVCRTRHPRLLHLQSRVQNPSGSSLDPARHRRVLDVAAAHGVLVLDDRTLEGTSFADPVRSLGATGSPGAMITIGSFNKLFWSGLRVGWIRADPDVVAHLVRLRGGTESPPSALGQEVASRLIDRLDEARDHRRRELRDSHDLAAGLLREWLPDWSWQRPTGGPTLWVELPRGDASRFASVAQQAGVSVLPEEVFTPRGIPNRHLRLSVAVPRAQLELGVERLAAAWSAFRV